MTLAVFYDDHRAVVEIAYALVIFFPGFHDEDIHLFSRNKSRLQGICQVINIEDDNALQGGNLVQVVVISHNLGVYFTAQPHQFGVYALDIIKIIIDNAYFYVIIFLHLLENIEATAAFITLKQRRL